MYREQDEHEVLTGTADLCIGKAALSIDDIGADAAERADVREQRGDEMCTAVAGAVEPPSEETPTDKSRKEDDKRKEKGQDEYILGQRQSPETEEREQRKEGDDIDADEAIEHPVGEQSALIENVADDERQNQIGDEEDQP